MKMLRTLSVCALLFVALNATDFSKTSDVDLAKMAGIVAPKDIVDYKKELRMRMKKMSKEKRAEFHKQLHEYAIKNTDNMTVAEFEAHKKAVQEELDKHGMKSMDKELGLKSCGCKNKHKHHEHKHHTHDKHEKHDEHEKHKHHEHDNQTADKHEEHATKKHDESKDKASK
ncbi:DUF1104 domain-containing protein [Helicobacter cetorum]|uniref:DUF1104 domain-containing protein n=1 Tax=Helicobacter cetorum (strain ATCC BAA-540 / CCUG 52418 / MIT 99-5656) TaxID=1163745 RepID=I0EQN6_HELCM|nr:DUF1104 domain-containing protein [Helicobacter cetorum]AFI05255.1 hypothetical protein HCD_01115 [Helicobacter cetorum MIT 99-5656]